MEKKKRRAQSADSSKTCSKPRAFNCALLLIQHTVLYNHYGDYFRIFEMSTIMVFESTTRLRTLIPNIGTHFPGMTLPRTAWVRLNRLRTGVGRFRSCLYKWGMAPSAVCECGAEKQKSRPMMRSGHNVGPTVVDS